MTYTRNVLISYPFVFIPYVVASKTLFHTNCYDKTKCKTDSNLGGSDAGDPEMNLGLASTFYYDFVENKWTKGPDMNQARYAFGCGSFVAEFPDGKRKVIAAIGKI